MQCPVVTNNAIYKAAFLAVTGVIVCVAIAFRQRQHRLCIPVLVRSIGVLVWPLLALMVHTPCVGTTYGILWLYAFWLLDMCLLCASNDIRGGLSIDCGSLIGIVFGLSALVGNRPNNKHCKLFVYCILGCFLVVLPRHNLPPSNQFAIVLDNSQKTLLLWCIALLITAIHATQCDTKNGNGL